SALVRQVPGASLTAKQLRGLGGRRFRRPFFLLVVPSRRPGARRRGRERGGPRQGQLEGTDLARHLLARREQRNRLVLQEQDAVVPRVELDSRTEGQGGDLLELLFLERRSLVNELGES